MGTPEVVDNSIAHRSSVVPVPATNDHEVVGEEEPIAADVPQHQRVETATDTSSIGGTWPPEMHASFDRIKGVYPHIISNPEDVNRFKEIFLGYNQIVGEEYRTRLQIRAIMSRDGLATIGRDGRLNRFVEAIVPLNPGSEWGLDPVFVYCSHNASSRHASPHDRQLVQQNIQQARTVEQQSFPDLLRRSSEKGYTVQILDVHQNKDSVINQLSALYERFGWDREEVRKIVESQNNIFACAMKDGKIVSAGIAEMAAVTIEGKTLRMVEITEAATDQLHEGNGCYLALSSLLLREVAERSSQQNILGGQVDIVFGENNGLSPAVMRISRKQGRTLSVQTGAEYGFPHSGILSQQVPIQTPGVNREQPYNDLVVASLTRTQLYKNYLG